MCFLFLFNGIVLWITTFPGHWYMTASFFLLLSRPILLLFFLDGHWRKKVCVCVCALLLPATFWGESKNSVNPFPSISIAWVDEKTKQKTVPSSSYSLIHHEENDNSPIDSIGSSRSSLSGVYIESDGCFSAVVAATLKLRPLSLCYQLRLIAAALYAFYFFLLYFLLSFHSLYRASSS